MNSWMFYTSHRLTEDMLKTVAERLGGEWQTLSTVRQGVVEKGDHAAVFLSLYPWFTDEYDDTQLATIRKKLADEPVSAVNIGIGVGPGSVELAGEVAAILDREWGGYLHTEDVLGPK